MKIIKINVELELFSDNYDNDNQEMQKLKRFIM